MPIPGRRYIVVQYEKDRVVEQPDETKLKSTVKQSEKDRVVTQAEKDRIVEQSDHSKLKGINKLTDGTHEFGTIYDYKTGELSLIVTRAAGKTTFAEEYGDNQTDVDIITPSSGKKICIAGIHTSMDADSGDISLDFATSNKKVWRHYGAKFKTLPSKDIHIHGAVDEALTLNSTQGNNNMFVMVNYREID